MNLLRETLNYIKLSNHEATDIIFIGSEQSGHSCTWEEFTDIGDINYDCGFGSQEIATDLIIVFSDGTKMWRDEYDGSERWEYSTLFKSPEDQKPIKCLVGTLWKTLSEVNKHV